MQTGFASGIRSRVGSALRRLLLAGEVVVRALVMTAALIVVGLSLQFLLYAEPYHLRWVAGESTFIVARGRQELVEALLSDRGLICLDGLEVLGCPSQDFDPHNRKLSRFHRLDPALLLYFLACPKLKSGRKSGGMSGS